MDGWMERERERMNRRDEGEEEGWRRGYICAAYNLLPT